MNAMPSMDHLLGLYLFTSQVQLHKSLQYTLGGEWGDTQDVIVGN